MLALVHPFDPSSSQDVSHRASPSSSRNRQHHHRKPTLSRESSSSSHIAPASSSSSLSTTRSCSNSSMTSSSSSSSRHASQPPARHQIHRHQTPSHPAPSSSSVAVPSDVPKTNGITPPSSVDPAPAQESSFDIQSFPSNDLLRLLASLLTQIAATNDKLDAASSASAVPSPSSSSPVSPEHHTPIWYTLTTASRSALSTPSSTLTFHARNIPTISLESYLLRILKYCPTTNEVFLSLLVYFDRMSKLSAESTGRSFVIDSYNIHRLVIAGVTVASKFFSDVFYTNSRYAKVGGLPQAELNQLELQFLLLNDFRLVIPRQEMQAYAEQLILFSSKSSSDSLSSFIASPTLSSNPSSSPTPRTAGPTLSIPTPRPNANDVTAPMRNMGAFDAYGGQIAGESTNSHSNHAYASYPHQHNYATPMQSESVVDPGHMGQTIMQGVAMPMTRQYAQRGYEPGHPLARVINPAAHQPHHALNGALNGIEHAVPMSRSIVPVGSEDSESDAGDGGETETETEAETETDGGWTTDDEPTIKPPRSSTGSSSSSSKSSRASDAQSICSSASEGGEGDDERDDRDDHVMGIVGFEDDDEGGKTPERAGRAEGVREGEKTPERKPLHEPGVSKINGRSKREEEDHSMASP